MARVKKVLMVGTITNETSVGFETLTCDLADGDSLTICINSSGGNVGAASRIQTAILKMRQNGVKTKAINLGSTNSAAMTIFLSCERRETFTTGTFLVHSAAYNVEHVVKLIKQSARAKKHKPYKETPLNVGDIQKSVSDGLMGMDQQQFELMARETGLTVETIGLRARDTWEFGPTEAMKLNIVHTILSFDHLKEIMSDLQQLP